MLRMEWSLWGCLCQSRKFTLSSQFSIEADKKRRTRLFSRSSRARLNLISLNVTCGLSGPITVDIYNSHTLSQPTSPLIIYLPPTGAHLRSTHQNIPSFLSSPRSPSALARINYRWNIPNSPSSLPKQLTTSPAYNSHPFPTPLHDTLHAYTFLINSLLPSYTPQVSQRSPYTVHPPLSKTIQRPVFIYGEYLGGTIATSLALTEAFASSKYPVRIAGLIAKDAIFDWTPVATSKDPRLLDDEQGGSNITDESDVMRWQQTGWDEQNIHSMKTKLFTNPVNAFDSFASPQLFFRTAGWTVPRLWPGTASLNPPTPLWDTLIDSSPSSTSIDHESEHGTAPTPYAEETKKPADECEITRISPLKYPPRDSGLKIPRSLFLFTPSPSISLTSSTASKNSLKKELPETANISPQAQSHEMARLMQRSVLLHELKDRKMWDGDLDPNSAAEDRAQAIPSDTKEEDIVRAWIQEGLDCNVAYES